MLLEFLEFRISRIRFKASKGSVFLESLECLEFYKLPHIPQIATTEQHETGGSLKRIIRRLSCTPYVPQATTHSTSYRDWGA